MKAWRYKATLQQNNWEHLSQLQRKTTSDNYYESFVQNKLAEWPKYNLEIIKKEFTKINYVKQENLK